MQGFLAWTTKPFICGFGDGSRGFSLGTLWVGNLSTDLAIHPAPHQNLLIPIPRLDAMPLSVSHFTRKTG